MIEDYRCDVDGMDVTVRYEASRGDDMLAGVVRVELYVPRFERHAEVNWTVALKGPSETELGRAVVAELQAIAFRAWEQEVAS